jgi:four helix bundle protein
MPRGTTTTLTFSFKDLIVWQKAVSFAENVIRIIDTLEAPRKHFRLIEQLEAACTSVPMNIAEGKGRQTTKDYIHFLYIARGSLFEVITLLVILKDLEWITEEREKALESEAQEITKMLNAMIKSLKSRSSA